MKRTDGGPWYFELQGAETNNKGAHLMALTVLDRFRRSPEDIEPCVYPVTAPKVLRADPLPALRVFPLDSGGGKRNQVKQRLRRAVLDVALPAKDMARYGLIARRQIDGLLDLSGYAYGDVWRRAEAKVKIAERYARAGKPVVLLPQMLGPFETSRARDEVRRLCDASRVVFARDRLSFEQAIEATGGSTKLARAPDITIGFGAREPLLGWQKRTGVLLVPNEKVLKKTESEWGHSYIERLVQVARHCRRRGEPVTLLVHEGGGGDERLAVEIAKQTEDPEISIWTSSDPLELKHELGRAKLVIGSRFHGLVSAFSSGTPAIALGWAHKYEMLVADFGVPELQHRGTDPASHLLELSDALMSSEAWEKCHRTILERRSALISELSDMWPRVAHALGLDEL